MLFLRKPTFAFLIVALALFAAPPLATAGSPPLAEEWNAPAIAWHDMRSGVPEAIRTGKTAVLVFHAPWCTACRKYREVFRDPRIVEATRDFVMILVDADADKVTNGAFAPDGTYVPRTLFLTPDGDVRTDLTGKTDPERPHTIDIHKPDELLALLERARGSSSDPARENNAQRADNR
jgi:thiol:disulfide interchange protein